MTQKAYSIGFYREDGDFQILATLNNLDGHMTAFDFDCITAHLVDTLAETTGKDVEALEREDAPSFVCTDDECWS